MIVPQDNLILSPIIQRTKGRQIIGGAQVINQAIQEELWTCNH